MLRKFWTLLVNLSRLPEIAGCYRETGQWLTVTLAYLGLRAPHFPFSLRLRSGEILTLEEHIDLIVFWMIFVRRHYPVRASDHVIVDVGANIGLFTLYAARQAPDARIIAIEPFPDTRRRLEGHLRDNRLTARVTVLDCAVAAEAGEGEMDSQEAIPSQYRRIHSEHTAALNPRHRGPAAAVSVPGVPVANRTLADILHLAQADNVDFMKMNIHGNEYAVLMKTPASVLRHFKRIACQYHQLPKDAKIDKKELFVYLRKSGFQLISDSDTRRGSGLAVLSVDPTV